MTHSNYMLMQRINARTIEVTGETFLTYSFRIFKGDILRISKFSHALVGQ